jgi:hypothetical protein
MKSKTPTTSPPDQCTPWLPKLLPMLDQVPLSNAYNFDLGFVGPGRMGQGDRTMLGKLA